MNRCGSYLGRTAAKVLAGALVAGASALVAVPAPAQAAGANLWGFAFVNNGAPPIPAATEASSSGLGAAVTGHPGPGTYQVTFFGIGTPPGANPGVVHVTAAPVRGAVWCQAWHWAPVAGNEVINILCFQSPGAARVNTNFSVTFASATPPAAGPYGYLVSNGGPGTVTQFNSAGRLITSRLVRPGLWLVIMPGLGGAGPATGGIQVTTAGARAGHCKVSGWRTTALQQAIRVACFTPAGLAANLPWTLTYQGGTDIVGNAPPDFGYVWHAGAAPPGTNFNSCPGAVNIVGPPPLFKITFPCIFAPMNDVQLSASGPNPDFCSLSSPVPWAPNGAAVIVRGVKCFHVNGAPSVADDFFATYTVS